MASINFNHRRHQSNRGPLKAFYIPQEAAPPQNDVDAKDVCSENKEDCTLVTGSIGSNDPPKMPRVPLAAFCRPSVGAKRKFEELQVEDADDSCEISCACCSPSPLPIPQPPSVKRPYVAMGAGGLRAMRCLPSVPQPICTPHLPTSIALPTKLGPVCSVPLPPRYSSQSNLAETLAPNTARRSIDTQTSPPETTPVRTPRVRRSSGAAVLVNSIKKKFEHLRRSFSTDRLGPATTPASPKKLNTLQMNKVEKATPIRPAEPICDLLRRFTDGSCLIQLRRQDTSVHFGIYIRRDEKGLYVSRISGLRAKRDPRGKQYLQVGDRVVEVQNVPAKGLEPDTVRGLLQGCHVATIRVKSPNSSRKFNQPR